MVTQDSRVKTTPEFVQGAREKQLNTESKRLPQRVVKRWPNCPDQLRLPVRPSAVGQQHNSQIVSSVNP
jgi:hypothetical protein